ncbi:MAG: histidine phosphatase family protein [bacterium]|nr:histidine phosphatase family protein [bacterium]
MLKLNNRYFILRHGQATSNIERWLASWPENPKVSHLTPKGIKQIKKDGQFFKKIGLDLIFSSDLTRTRETAKIVSQATKAPVIYKKGFRELNVGIFKDRPISNYRKYFHNHVDRFTKRPPKGENLNECKKKMFQAFQEINKKYKNKNILIVSHGDPLWLLEGAIKNKTPMQMAMARSHRLWPGNYRELK